MPLIFVILLIVSFSTSYALEKDLRCYEKIQIQIPTGPKTKRLEITNICLSEKSQTFISKNCKNKNCLAYTENKIIDVAWSTVGTPGSRLCYKLGGVAQIINLKVNNKEFKTDRCYFEKDQSFVDIGTLAEYNRELENNLKEKL